MKLITFDQCDSFEDVLKHINNLRADNELLNAKVVQLGERVVELEARPIAKSKGNKKGHTTMNNTWTMLVAALLIAMVFMTIGQGLTKTEITYDRVTNPDDLVTLLRAGLVTTDGSGGVTTLGTGNIYYVDSGKGNAATVTGKTWATAEPTLDDAVNNCTANNGDIILVAQGHNEALSAASDVDIDVAGVTVIGLGTGSLKPTFDYDAATADMFVIGADNVTIKNLRFRVSTNATANAIDIPDGIDYATILECEFGFAETATDEFTDAVQLNDASNYCTIRGCYFDAGAQAAAAAVVFSKDTKGTIIEDNVFIGTYSVSVIEGDTTASTNLLIDGNRMYTGGTADTFNLVAASTGIVSNNIITMNSVSAATALDIGNCLSMGNTLIADDDVGGAKGEPAFASAYASVTASADD